MPEQDACRNRLHLLTLVFAPVSGSAGQRVSGSAGQRVSGSAGRGALWTGVLFLGGINQELG